MHAMAGMAIPTANEFAVAAGTDCCELCRLRRIARRLRTVHVPTCAANQLPREHGHGEFVLWTASTAHAEFMQPGAVRRSQVSLLASEVNGERQARPCSHGSLSTFSFGKPSREPGIMSQAQHVIAIPAAFACAA